MTHRQKRILLAASTIALSSPALATSHPHGLDFLHHAIEGDNSEIELGAMAAEHGANPRVRAFGRMLHQDHSQHRAEAAALAKRMHSFVPRSLSAEAIREKGKLSRLRGGDFDREFARYMVDDHRKDIGDYEDEANFRDKPALTSMAEKTLPTLQKHLATAERLAGR
jgi:putative membrane protein